MPVILRTAPTLHTAGPSDYWLAVTGTSVPYQDNDKILPQLAERLEACFDRTRAIWWELGARLGALPTSEIAHTPTCAPYNCDLGLMMAWSLLVEELAAEDADVLVLCDDPWLFRQLATLPGVEAGKAPTMRPYLFRGWLRGFLARIKYAVRAAKSAMDTKASKANHKPSETDSVLVVYGHPASKANGFDAYFGDLMKDLPGVRRLLHTDCGPVFANRLAADKRTASLHAWGRPMEAIALIVAKWAPPEEALKGPWYWLLKRAVVRENATAAPASNLWQQRCQARWLADVRPRVVAWPFENHPWERQFVRDSRAAGAATIGYQHAVIGPHQFNPAPQSNWDGFNSYPDRVLCSGPAYRDQLEDWGVPETRLGVAGAFRVQPFDQDLYDKEGPVFVALSAVRAITREMMEAVKLAEKPGRVFLIKAHPLYPMDVEETESVRRTSKTLPEQDRVSAIFYGTGTSGLEGLFSGAPTFRLLSSKQVAVNVLPTGIDATAVTVTGLRAALDHAHEAENAGRKLPFETVYTPADMEIWRKALDADSAKSALQAP
ncbi:MAG: hypothetical protein ACPGOV_01825 [Magnetovibrionaceae bacterium]